MVKIWYMDGFDGADPRLPHMAFPPKYLTPEKLKKRTGVFLWKIPVNEGMVTQMEWISREHKFVTDNTLEVKEGLMPRLADKIQEWYKPHVHAFEESRLVMDGQAYYDVEDPQTGDWIRILIETGDFIIIPVGCLHRFTTDTKNYVKLKRFYQTNDGEPHPISEEMCSVHIGRVEYLKSFKKPSSPTKTIAPN